MSHILISKGFSYSGEDMLTSGITGEPLEAYVHFWDNLLSGRYCIFSVAIRSAAHDSNRNSVGQLLLVWLPSSLIHGTYCIGQNARSSTVRSAEYSR